MASPINSFETIESIRFLAQLVGTEGISEQVKEKTNEYLLRLINSLESAVNETVSLNTGLKIVKY